MLFSDWQATTHALQPLHLFRSIAMPQAYPGYLNSLYSESSFATSSCFSCEKPGFFLYSSSVAVLRICRPSMLKWYCVQASEYPSPVAVILPPAALHIAFDVRTIYALNPLFVPA